MSTTIDSLQIEIQSNSTNAASGIEDLAKALKKLSKNKWIKNITNKSITYTDEFKYKLVKECEDYKKFPQDVFRECGIDPEIVGRKRYEQAAYKWRKQLNSIGEIKDSRKGFSGRPLGHELSDK